MSGHVVVAVDRVIAAGIAACIREAAEDWAPYAAKKAEEYAKALESAVPVEPNGRWNGRMEYREVAP